MSIADSVGLGEDTDVRVASEWMLRPLLLDFLTLSSLIPVRIRSYVMRLKCYLLGPEAHP